MRHLRPYQAAALQGITEAARDYRSSLLVLPTGCGKTEVFTAAAGEVVKRGQRVLIMAHRQELVMQAADKVDRRLGIKADIEMAESVAELGGLMGRSPVVCASKDSLRSRLAKYDWDQFGLVITDEAHHATAKSYRMVYDAAHSNPDLHHLGVTATPDRKDEEALGQIYETVAYSYEVRDAVVDGYLVPIRQSFVQCEQLDFSEVRTRAGDLDQQQLARVLEEERALHEMVTPTVKLAGDRRCLVFAATVAQAKAIAEIIDRHSCSAQVVDGTMDSETRRRTFENFAKGDTQYLVNVGIATEGWDDPATDGKGVQVIAVMRPTQSRSLYAQMLGRGTRPLPGTVDGPGLETAEARRASIAASNKPCVEVLDYCGNAGRHRLVHAADILGGTVSDAAAERYNERHAGGRGDAEGMDVLAELDRMEQELIEERAAERRRQVKAREAKVRIERMDPFEQVGIVPRRVPAYMPRKEMTPKQIGMLERNGIRNIDDLSRAEASQIIDKLMSQPSAKQAGYLVSLGYRKDDVQTLSKTQASAVIDATKQRGRPWPSVADAMAEIREAAKAVQA